MTNVLKEDFESEDYDTLNGFLISKLERIPDEGEQTALDIDGYRYQILSVKDRMISLVKVTKLLSEENDNKETGEISDKNTDNIILGGK